MPHGHQLGYLAGCEECRLENRLKRRRLRAANPTREAEVTKRAREKARNAAFEAIPHGTAGGYTNYNCRCDACHVAHNAMGSKTRRARIEKRKGLDPSDIPHGLKGYREFGCRCSICAETRRIEHLEWRIKNRDHVRERHNAYLRMRRANDPAYKIIANLRTSITALVRKRDARKSEPTLKIIGCDLSSLKRHLESKFAEGMRWDNYGEWHIDHIRPCASFDVTDKRQLAQCFHFTNLQPLWASDNCSKQAKILPEDVSG